MNRCSASVLRIVCSEAVNHGPYSLPISGELISPAAIERADARQPRRTQRAEGTAEQAGVRALQTLSGNQRHPNSAQQPLQLVAPAPSASGCSNMPASLIVGGTGVSGSFIVSGLIERGHDVTVYTTGRTVPTEEESPWWYDGSITRLEGGVDSAEDVDATLTEAYGAAWAA